MMKCKVPICIVDRYWFSNDPAEHKQIVFFGTHIKLLVSCKNMHEIWYVAGLQTWSSLMSQLRKNFIKFAACSYVGEMRKFDIDFVNINTFQK